MGKLEEKVAIITGATQGMGRAMAIRFAKEGASVVINGRDQQRGEQVVEEISSNGGTAHFVQADISSRDANEELVEQAVQQFGRLDIVVANAGILGLGSITDVEEDTWHKTIDTNLNAVFYLIRAAIPQMKKAGLGCILVTGSIAAHKGFPNHAAYCASKGAVEALVRQLAVDYAPKIRVNLIQPGAVDTQLYEDSAVAFPNPDTVLDEVPENLPMKRIGSPEEIAKMALFLVSEDSDWVTGSVFTIDGGASAAG